MTTTDPLAPFQWLNVPEGEGAGSQGCEVLAVTRHDYPAEHGFSYAIDGTVATGYRLRRDDRLVAARGGLSVVQDQAISPVRPTRRPEPAPGFSVTRPTMASVPSVTV
ncbi:hypothetical protein [Nonomuraea sp. NPDC050643]|uniref:hypothetical protein n=1 Tax=Nonomuraea sp. NPDC050643 TaxID=3155660 RepID=UPI00340FA3C8